MTYLKLLKEQRDLTYYPKRSTIVYEPCPEPKLKLEAELVKWIERKIHPMFDRYYAVGKLLIIKRRLKDKGFSEYTIVTSNGCFSFTIAGPVFDSTEDPELPLVFLSVIKKVRKGEIACGLR